MSEKAALVFDIGAHMGDDTSVYLKMGYQVLALEANPLLIEQLHTRFSTEVASGRLSILHAAIGRQNNGQVPLYLQEDSSKSSVQPCDAKEVTMVPGRSLASVVQQFGKPYFCKIDIEGNDLVALESLAGIDPPEFVSVEASGTILGKLHKEPNQVLATLEQLRLLGYNSFKLVDQERLSVLSTRSFYKANLRFRNRVLYKLQRWSGMDTRSRFVHQFSLPFTSELSGWPGDKLRGNWVNYDEMKCLLLFHLQEYLSVAIELDFIFWVDLHAMKG